VQCDERPSRVLARSPVRGRAVRAFIVTAPYEAGVYDVDAPVAAPGGVVIDVERVGVCGTDVDFYTGEMQYLHDGHAHFPMRLGHEWSGTVSAVGDGVDESWLAQRVMGDTMLGCGTCRRCLNSLQHVCEFRFEVGVRNGFAGALAEQIAVPASSLHRLPPHVDAAMGALVEPGANALRAVWAADLKEGDRVLILGPGTIGLLCAYIAKAQGAQVHVMGRSASSLNFARSLGFDGSTSDDLPDLPFDAVIDASNDAGLPARALDLVEPGKRVVFIGISGTPSLIDSRVQVLNDVTSVGILSGSPGLGATIDLYASGGVDPRSLIAMTTDLEGVGAILAGERVPDAGSGPKFHVDPRVH
jgi:threonine dehydrogenase-like Zn-dependent dehydrogenase